MSSPSESAIAVVNWLIQTGELQFQVQQHIAPAIASAVVESLRKDQSAALATARAEGAEAMRERCAVEARGYCRAGENCMRDGGCRHVPCITARQIEGAIRALDVREGDANGR